MGFYNSLYEFTDSVKCTLWPTSSLVQIVTLLQVSTDLDAKWRFSFLLWNFLLKILTSVWIFSGISCWLWRMIYFLRASMCEKGAVGIQNQPSRYLLGRRKKGLGAGMVSWHFAPSVSHCDFSSCCPQEMCIMISCFVGLAIRIEAESFYIYDSWLT